MENQTFGMRIQALGAEASTQIINSIQNNGNWWEPDFDGQVEGHEIGDDWVTFDDVAGNGHYLVGITLDADKVTIHSLTMEDGDADTHTVDGLSPEALCIIADAINH